MMKLRLRPCKREDGREVMKWFSDERQMRMWCRDGFTFPLTDGQMDAYYAELEGYIVLAPEVRGRGVGQQMVSMAVTYAVELLGMKRVTLKVFDCNPGAKHCYEKVGFREEEYRKEDFPYREEMWGNSLMAYNRR